MYTWILAFIYMNDMCFNLGQICGLSSQCTSNQTAACTWFRTEETINYILWKCILKSIFLNILLTTLQKPTKHTHNVNMHSPCDQFLVSRGLVIVWRSVFSLRLNHPGNNVTVKGWSAGLFMNYVRIPNPSERSERIISLSRYKLGIRFSPINSIWYYVTLWGKVPTIHLGEILESYLEMRV